MPTPIWHLHSRATHHVIIDPSNLATSHDIDSIEILLVSDGKSFSIFSIGSNYFPSHINNHRTL